MHQFFAFLQWCARKAFGSIARLNRNFIKFMSSYPGEALFVWFVASMGICLVATLCAIPTGDFEVLKNASIISWVLCFTYLVTIVVYTLYSTFTEEQQDIINRLKEKR